MNTTRLIKNKMNIFKALRVYFFPREFTHFGEDFFIEPVRSWFSSDYYEIRYSANGKESWKYLMEVKRPLFSHSYECLRDYKWKWERICFKPERESFSYYKNRFKTYQDILDHYEEQEIRYEKGETERKRLIEIYEEIKRENLK